MKTASQKIDALLQQAAETAIAEVERMARKIMKDNPRCKAFCMGMGGYSFYDVNGESISEDRGFKPYPAYLKPLDNFIDEFDRACCITGTPMRIIGHDGVLQTKY